MLITEPVTEVIGGPDIYIDRGSTINLTCTVKFSPKPPNYILWNHNDAVSKKHFIACQFNSIYECGLFAW